ncbi:hypothetical protein J2849_006098 [Azospirillum melinis]|nr:hypothetical protein [Azospirillum melinis]
MPVVELSARPWRPSGSTPIPWSGSWVTRKSKRHKEQILGLQCVPDHHDKPWGDVLRSIERRTASDRQEARNLLVHFAIVVSLRAISGDLVQRMRNFGMQVEIDRSELLKDMFDSTVTQGAERGHSEHAIEMLREELDFAGVALSDEDQDFVEQLSASDADTLRRQVRNGEDWPVLVSTAANASSRPEQWEGCVEHRMLRETHFAGAIRGASFPSHPTAHASSSSLRCGSGASGCWPSSALHPRPRCGVPGLVRNSFGRSVGRALS